MNRLLHQIGEQDRNLVGGKAYALARMVQSGMTVAPAVCIGADAYGEFVSETGLRERIFMELHRKQFEQMRWEELWDASLRIRNMFLKTPMPERLHDELHRLIEAETGDSAVVVRSSAPGEDSAKASFAGLHESYVNVKGLDSILEHVRLVWASLWSDRALLYRQELGLDIEKSSMAVVVQELVCGERSGVVFGKSPLDESQAVIEAVYGLNQGLVDGTVEPDRWILKRETGALISHSPARREKAMVPSAEGARLEPLPREKSDVPPLRDDDTHKVFDLARRAESVFKSPQDVEWTFRGDSLYTLQSRPITAAVGETADDQRSWYRSLTRSFENLKALREKIEKELIPAMIEEGDRLAGRDPADLPDPQLAAEIARRSKIHKKWEAAYWDDFIPFAHGARLFGQVYNDTMHPSDPYEFTQLLGGTRMVSIERNRMLADMADMIRNSSRLERHLKKQGYADSDREFRDTLDGFIEKFGDLAAASTPADDGREGIVKLLLQMAARDPVKDRSRPDEFDKLAGEFLSRFEGEQKGFATELLDLARASYRLRDDDNIYIGRIESGMAAALREGRRRIGERLGIDAERLKPNEIVKALKNPDYRPVFDKAPEKDAPDSKLKARQLTGQPAGAGIGTGKARIIENDADLFGFQAGEILVCDAIDPNMTFVVPLSAGVVERRGGMLIHGAIVAREYGLPCVTGVPDATSLIRTGQQVTVDGFLGIVILGTPPLAGTS